MSEELDAAGAGAESSFDLAVDAICDLVEGDSAPPPPPPPMTVQTKEGDTSTAVSAAADAHAGADPSIGKKPAEGVYINKDGKKVRRVKRSEKRTRQKGQDTAAAGVAPAEAAVPSEVQANQRAQSEAEAQRQAAAAASAALLKAALPPAASTTSSSATSVSRSALDSAGDDYKAMPSSSFGHGVNNNNEHHDDNEDDEASEGDWDLEYKTGLAKHHEDAERQMLEGEEGRRGFASTDDEDEYEDEEDDSRHETYTNDPNTCTASAMTAPSVSTRTEAGPATPKLSSNDVRNPFDDEQVANVVPPGATEGPSPAAEDCALDPGDIRAALSSSSGGNDMTENDLNHFDPLHVAQEGSTTQTTLPPSQPPQLPHPGVKSPDESVMSQGPLWEEAGRVAAAATESHQQYLQLHPQQENTTNGAAIGQTIRDEYWSRAAVDAGEVAPDTLFRAGAAPHPTAPHPNEMERVATKRVNVVQLLINGLIGLVGGLFGSIYVQGCCHFVTVDVGLPLHFGLWQYSPMDSAFQGFTYCYRYDSDYTHDSPTFARLAGLTALLAGAFSMSVLWVYLLFGRTSSDLWMWAVRFLVMATSLQALTFSFFANDVCRRNSCSIGPGSIVSLVSTLSWALVAYEMKDNSPAVSALIPDPHMTMNQHQQQQGGNSGNSGVELTGGYYRPPSTVGLGVAV